MDETEIPCAELGPALDVLIDQLGFRLETIMPADDPSVAVISGHGLRLRLDASGGASVASGELPPAVALFEISRPDGAHHGAGRAGMSYRDLLPLRQGGRVIASHITIPGGGPVADYVHHHDIRYQSIHCVRGWVRVVYEDQGPPFVLEAGDCVLQPPGIRHRVLESSPGLEVVEVGSPATHPTHVDHELGLPTTGVDPQRVFGRGQRFVLHRASTATPGPWRAPGFECEETGVGAATDGLAGTRTVRSTEDGASTEWWSHDGELLFWFVVGGSAVLRLDGRDDETLDAGVAVAIPPRLGHRLVDADRLDLLEVTFPRSLPGSG